MDLIPEIKVTVFRDGEAEPSLPIEELPAKVDEKQKDAPPVQIGDELAIETEEKTEPSA